MQGYVSGSTSLYAVIGDLPTLQQHTSLQMVWSERLGLMVAALGNFRDPARLTFANLLLHLEAGSVPRSWSFFSVSSKYQMEGILL